MNVKNIFYIIITASLLGLFYNFFSPRGIKLIRDELTIEYVTDSSFYTDASGETGKNLAMKGINTKQAYNIFINNMATFIDGRDQWEYGESHIKRAINIPEFSFEPDNPDVLSLSRNDMYVLYCEGDDCDVSKRLASEFIKLGFKNIYVYLGGFNEWTNAAYPIEGSSEK